MESTLKIDSALLSTQGLKSLNEDCAIVEVPTNDHLFKNKGIVLAVADGVSSAEAGMEASSTAITRFVEDYYNTPDTWSVSHSGEKILSTINLKLYRQSHEFTNANKGYLCTFSAVVIKGKTAHFFHVGDSRIYHLRNGNLNQVTEDHTGNIIDGKAFLSRAMGMDNLLHLDYGKFPIEKGDRLLVSSDGIHDFLSDTEILELLSASESLETIAESLKEFALRRGSDDNLSVVLANIESLPEESIDDYNAKLVRLPFPPSLEPGMKLDGYVIEKELFASSRSQLYQVRDEKNGKVFAMKTPSRNFEDDFSYIDRFIQEEWIGSRINSPYVVDVHRQKKPRRFLYYLMEYLQGIGLDQWMLENPLPSPKRAISIVKQIGLGLQAFHDMEAIHQDLKPANVMITKDEKDDIEIKIVDFGSVHVSGLAELYRTLEHNEALGTAGYSDPQYLMGSNAGFQGDVYSLATITYEMFTGKLPYSDKVENCKTAYDYDRLRYNSASQFNLAIPQWFDRALEKGVKLDPQQRYLNIESLMRDLTQPNLEFLKDDPVVEQRSSTVLFWQLVSGFWFVTFLLVVYLFSQAD